MPERRNATTSLDDLLADAKSSGALTHADKDITSKNFSEAGVRGTLVLVDLKLGGRFSTQKALETLDRLGYRPATMYEGVKYANTLFANGGWDRNTTVAILGSVWLDSNGYGCVGCLWSNGAERELSLHDVDSGWDIGYPPPGRSQTRPWALEILVLSGP